MIEIKEKCEKNEPKILIIGVGGGGNNAIDRMIKSSCDNVTYAAVNTDIAVLENCLAEKKIQIGSKLLKGYGAGANPSMGEEAAKENEDNIKELISDYNMIIITCGLGGGTGTGAIPIIANICKDTGILTIAVVTMPFSFEGKPRMKMAEIGLEKLKSQVDTLLVIPNDKLIGISDKPLMLDAAFEMADTILKYTIDGISNIIFNKGMVNIDFNDVKTIMTKKGIGHLGIGTVDSDGSLLDAAKKAIDSPLLDTTISGCTDLLINISGNASIDSINEAIEYITDIAGTDVNVIWGTVKSNDPAKDNIVVTLIATGMSDNASPTNNNNNALPILDDNTFIDNITKKTKTPPQEIAIPEFLKKSIR